ncbi:MAG: hypothetical protein F6K42_26835 [Leptolyngbya sp. SIO1D8]|nr:hypothetical protein [Leptolyngbya sp. SIO1D8]
MKKATWQDQTGFIVKVFGVSTLMAIALKTIAPRLPIPATSASSLAIVLTPTLVMGTLLCWQLWNTHHPHAATAPRNH